MDGVRAVAESVCPQRAAATGFDLLRQALSTGGGVP